MYRCVISEKYKRQDITRVHNIINVDLKMKGTMQVLIPLEYQYLNLMMLIGSDSMIQSVPCWKGNYGSIVGVLNGHHIA